MAGRNKYLFLVLLLLIYTSCHPSSNTTLGKKYSDTNYTTVNNTGQSDEISGVVVDKIPVNADKSQKSLFDNKWFWTVLTVIVIGAIISIIAATSDDDGSSSGDNGMTTDDVVPPSGDI